MRTGVRDQVPWEEFGDAVDRMLCDAGQDGAEVERWIKAVELGGADERVEGSGADTAGVGAEEEVVLPSD